LRFFRLFEKFVFYLFFQHQLCEIDFFSLSAICKIERISVELKEKKVFLRKKGKSERRFSIPSSF